MSNTVDSTQTPSVAPANSNFDFLAAVLNGLAKQGGSDVFSQHCTELLSRVQNAEANIKADPRIAGFYARNALELMVDTVFDIDNWLTRPRHDASLMSLIHEQSFKQILSSNLFPKLKLI